MKVIVIGAGPSGLMSASVCAKNGHDVTIIEKNEKVGKKLYITGKGRCNVTNNSSCEDFLNNVIRNSKFLYGSIFSFSPLNTINLLEDLGVKVKTERGNRVFPESDKSSDIIKALQTNCLNNFVKIKLNEEVENIYKDENIFNVITTKTKYQCDAVILCTGGNSYKSTGSDGFGYKLAKRFGHTITDIKPALCPIKLKDNWVKSIEGLSLKNVSLNATINNKPYKSLFGEMMFSSNGITGPIVLSMSSYINRLDNIKLYIDFKPALTYEKLENRILRELDSNKNNQINTILNNLLPKNLIDIFLNYCSIDKTKKANSITIKERKDIVNSLKQFNLNFDRLYDIDYAIITSGGINTKEVNPKTMESKLVKNLFFAGEILDIDALTGGYNIQIALSTGYCAGKGV